MTLWLNKSEKAYIIELVEADMLADVDGEENEHLNATKRKKLLDKIKDVAV